MDEQTSLFTTVTTATQATDAFTTPESRYMKVLQESAFSPLAPPFQSRRGDDLHTMMSQEEPRVADTAPQSSELGDGMGSFQVNDPTVLFDDLDQHPHSYYASNSRPGSVSSNIWGDNSSVAENKNPEITVTSDFFIKCVASAHSFVSTLTREQLSVLRSIRPGILYDLLMEVAKVRSEKRISRALPNECAFCKNNGEIEACYTAHVLKDWRGRVLCPVLRAFRCPRCGATGDRAHTIKYCPENDADRSGVPSRRRMTPASLLASHSRAPLSTPAPSPSPASAELPQSSFWSSPFSDRFDIN